jgi:hypothetical protein
MLRCGELCPHGIGARYVAKKCPELAARPVQQKGNMVCDQSLAAWRNPRAQGVGFYQCLAFGKVGLRMVLSYVHENSKDSVEPSTPPAERRSQLNFPRRPTSRSGRILPQDCGGIGPVAVSRPANLYDGTAAIRSRWHEIQSGAMASGDRPAAGAAACRDGARWWRVMEDRTAAWPWSLVRVTA